jgi:hypothetical protein
MKREIPMLITVIAGLGYILFFFIPHWPFNQIGEMFNNWIIVISAFAILLGVGSLIKVHGDRISRKTEGWPYSIILLLGLFTTAILGIALGLDVGSPFDYIFRYFYTPMGSTMFSLLAFFIASAAFRAFRAQSKEATMLLIAAFFVMLGRVPLGELIWSGFPKIANWLMNYPSTAGQRAIMIGAALGVVSTSIKILIGIDKSYLGGD